MVPIGAQSRGRRERSVAAIRPGEMRITIGPKVAVGFDRELFDELVHYIAWRMRDEPRFGRTKIAKTMFFADFTAYAEEGKPLTGARYFHWPKGPFTPELYRTEERLVARGVASLEEPEFEGDEAKLRAPSFAPARTTAFHRAYLDIKMDEIAEQGTARAVSDKSHEHPGWRVTTDRQEIPYSAVHIPGEGPTRRDIDAALAVAREHGWA
jgi:uncharacterized phage-associated protein